MDEYFEYLQETDFPEIENRSLLEDEVVCEVRGHGIENEIEIKDFILHAFGLQIKDMQQRIVSDLTIKDGVVIVDTRRPALYEHFSVPKSINIELKGKEFSDEIPKSWFTKKVFIMCSHGHQSAHVAEDLRHKGVEAYSVKGGLTAYSHENLPRVMPETCLVKHR
jgi:rhodanese-related sulfurtransferase